MATYDAFSKIISLGDDQKSNQFELAFTGGIPGSSLPSDSVTLRIDQSFDIPDVLVGEYEFFHKGFKFNRPSKVEETDKHLTLQVRVDQKWDVFDALYNWRKAVYDWNTNTYALSNAVYGDTFSTVGVIKFLDGQNASRFEITLQQLILKGIQIASLDPSSNEPTRLTLNLMFGNILFAKK